MNNAEYLIELLKCAVTGSKISEPDADIDFEKIYEIAGKHNVQMTAYYGIKKLKYSLPVEASAKWENMHLHGISRSIRQLAELQNICDTFAKEKIVHMPLKGSLIKHLYLFLMKEMACGTAIIRIFSTGRQQGGMNMRGY